MAHLTGASIIGGYKAAVTRHARRARLGGDGPLWQRRYHDRIVRNERERNAIGDYIHDNPRRWHEEIDMDPVRRNRR